MSPARILVINPNSNERVTAGIAATLSRFERPLFVEIECSTLKDGPYGIETEQDIATVEPLLENKIRASPNFDAYVIACYSDPGLQRCRQLTRSPVLGIQAAALSTAIAFGGKFGVISLSEESIFRHLAYIRELGFEQHLAGEFALNLSVAEAEDPTALDRVIEAGSRLISEAGARILILGCAGMAGHRAPAHAALGIPVLDPTQAAVAIALA